MQKLEKSGSSKLTLEELFPISVENPVRVFPPMTTLLPSVNHLFLIRKGVSKRVISCRNNSEELTIQFGSDTTPYLFGIENLGDQLPDKKSSYHTFVQSLSRVAVQRVSVDYVMSRMGDPLFGPSMLAYMAQTIELVNSRQFDVQTMFLTDRLQKGLYDIADQLGGPKWANGDLMITGLSQTEIAKYVSASRATVSTRLGEMENSGIISRRRGGTILLPNKVT